MGIGSVLKTGLKYLKAIPRYAFGSGNEVIQNARKAKYAPGKSFESIFTNPVEKAKAGLKALKSDLKATANKPGFFSGLKNLWKSGISKAATSGAKLGFWGTLKAGLGNIGKSAISAVKGAYKSGGIKGLLKPLCKMPFIATVATLVFEAPDIIDAFSRGGFVEGCKQVLRSGAKIVVGTAFSAVGAAFGGFVGGIAGYALGEYLAGLVCGKPYSETHPKDEAEQTQEQEVPPQGNEDEQTQNQDAQTPTDNNSPSNPTGTNPTATNPTTTNPSTTNPSTTNPITSGIYGTGFTGMTGLTGSTMTNPFLTGMTGINDPITAITNNWLKPGENIFEKYPLGYRFQYLG